MGVEGQYIDLYRENRGLLEAGSCGVLNARRGEALARLEACGLPSPKTERYRYTDVQAAFAPDFGLNLGRKAAQADPQRTFRCNVPGLNAATFFVINDVVFPIDGTKGAVEGAEVASLQDYAAKNPRFIEEYYHRIAAQAGDGVTELNTLLVQDGIVIRIPDGVRLTRPIQIVNVSSAAVDVMSNRRVLLVAGKDTEASVLFCDHAVGSNRYLTTQVVEVYAAERASLDLCAIEETGAANTRFCNMYAEQQAGSHLRFTGITLTCGTTCNRADFRLSGEGAMLSANGAVIADARQRADNNILAEHIAPRCTSDMLYKYVLDGESVGAFAGKVLVRPGAQHTASEQVNANLCASPSARAYAQPMLEIYADDVKCNHGSTVGKLDETALFYMRQRGIAEAEARLLLQHAFINDVLRRVEPEMLRERLSRLVEMRFRGELSKCEGCRMCK